jgi:hypothetical protein
MRRKGRKVNVKRVQRVRREAGLQVRKKQKRMRRRGPTNPQRLRALRRNEVWSWDLILSQSTADYACHDFQFTDMQKLATLVVP